MKKAVVLSGGGSHGAYQIGVWKALKKINYKYEIVTGTSIGAINGVVMVENDIKKAIHMWENLDFNMIFEEKLENDVTTEAGKIEIIKMYAKNIIFNGGMNVSKLEETLAKAINVKKFYASPIDYGLITVKSDDMKAITLTKKEIQKLDLKDYIIASSTCYPFFKKKKIKNDLYIDGGYFDNLPINLAIDMGAKEIIAVDLQTVGIRKRVKNEDVKITYITPKNDLGSFLFFDKSASGINIDYGYNDAMKVFQLLDGNIFTFKKNHLEKVFNKYYYPFLNNLEEVLNKKAGLAEKILMISSYKYFLNYDLVKSQQIFLETIEYLGKIFKLDSSVIYDINKYNKILIDKFELIDNHKTIKEKDFYEKDKFNLFDKESIIKYLYYKIIDYNFEKKDLTNLALLFKKEFLAAIYLVVICKQKKENKNIFKFLIKNKYIF